MKRLKRFLVPALLIGILLLVLGGFFVYRNLNEDIETVDQSQDIDVSQVKERVESNPEILKKQGTFKDGDAIHKGSGRASIVEFEGKPVLKFEDFQVTQGPDLFVYLSPNPAGGELGDFVSLGRLKSNTGDQVYNLPDGYERYKSVVIWCRAFSVTFASAYLE
jgi:hypothetical protein